MEAINDVQSLKEACRWAFEDTRTAPSAAQQQVGDTLRHTCRPTGVRAEWGGGPAKSELFDLSEDSGLSEEDEVGCPKSGYSINLLAIARQRTGDGRREDQRGRGEGS